MKQKNFMYLFATALVAGTMGITSCTSELDDPIHNGKVNDVTLSVAVANKAAHRSTADEVNMGTTMQNINNIVIVPMIGQAYLNPIVMGDLTAGASNKEVSKTAALNSNVNAFKVYGNVAVPNAFDEGKVFGGFNVTLAAHTSMSGYYQPHGLYYYAHATAGSNDLKAGADKNSQLSTITGNIGTNKYVQISGVNYAVGVLATAVFNADATTNYIIGSGATSANAVVSNDNVEFKGIIINKQDLTLDADFNVPSTGGTKVSVYDECKKGNVTTFQTRQSVSPTNNNKGAANLYTIVSATGEAKDTKEGDIVTGNLVFTLKNGFKLKTNSGEIDATQGAKTFYLAFQLSPDKTANKAVFMKDYSTFFNARVKNWGLASDQPINVTDATIAVQVDMTWQEGIVYDQEI